MSDVVDPNVRAVLDQLKSGLPVIFARERIGDLTGGLLTPTRMRDLDCKGKGPRRGRIQLNGKKVGYLRDDFLEWLGKHIQSKDGCEC